MFTYTLTKPNIQESTRSPPTFCSRHGPPIPWIKAFHAYNVGKLMPNLAPSECWQIVSVDMIGELPDSRGFNAILVVVDRLSKCIHVVPTVTSLDSTGVACLFLENVWQHHGLPKQILSDHIPAFISHFSRELANLLGLYLTNSFRQMARQRG